MYNILFCGKNKEYFSCLQDGLPETMELIYAPPEIELHTFFKTHSPIAIVLSLSEPMPLPDDLYQLQKLVVTPNAPRIIVTAKYLTVSQAVCVMRNGAYDCFTGALSGEALGYVINRLIAKTKISSSTKDLILGQSEPIISLKQKLFKYAKLNYPILITGETGSGKELAAKTIHVNSSHKGEPFIAVNCANYADELLSSELFGSCRGAFTGATDRHGLFEHAQEGTIFLDEIGELSLSGQCKLLRVIEEKTMRRIGSTKLQRVKARIIAATNQNLKQLSTSGRFRPDLYYRLNLLSVAMPALREHREDIPLLARSYLNQIEGDFKEIDSSAMKVLMEYHWPGNVRELQSVVLKSSLNTIRNSIGINDIVFD